MEAALSLIHDLLPQYGHTYQANLAMSARERFASFPQDARRLLTDEASWH